MHDGRSTTMHTGLRLHSGFMGSPAGRIFIENFMTARVAAEWARAYTFKTRLTDPLTVIKPHLNKYYGLRHDMKMAIGACDDFVPSSLGAIRKRRHHFKKIFGPPSPFLITFTT